MKYIKEMSEFESSSKFEPDEIQDLKDVYTDIVYDLDLYDNLYQILDVGDSSFKINKEGTMIGIWIRTIVINLTSSATGNKSTPPTKEELDYHKSQLSKLEDHAQRLRNMGYKVFVNIHMGGQLGDLYPEGIKIEITK